MKKLAMLLAIATLFILPCRYSWAQGEDSLDRLLDDLKPLCRRVFNYHRTVSSTSTEYAAVGALTGECSPLQNRIVALLVMFNMMGALSTTCSDLTPARVHVREYVVTGKERLKFAYEAIDIAHDNADRPATVSYAREFREWVSRFEKVLTQYAQELEE